MREILGCDVLGDNKYSAKKDSPQNLSKYMIKMLKLKNEWDVRFLPTFIHLGEISFCSLKNESKQINIKCPLPEYFTTALELLKIK